MKLNIIPPALIFEVDKIEGYETITGSANGFVIRIEKDAANKDAILAHELVHVKQWWLSLGIHPILYALSECYRIWAEVQAYKKSIEYGAHTKESAARVIADKYNISKYDYEYILEQFN